MGRDQLAAIDSSGSSDSGYFPRLPIFSFLVKSPEDSKPFSPPPNMKPSVPFQWEEVPGKPKPFYITGQAATASELRLPPRLFEEDDEEEHDTISPLSEIVRKQLMETDSDSLGGKAGEAVTKSKRKSGFFSPFRRKSHSWATMYQRFKRMGFGCSCRPESREDFLQDTQRRRGFG